MNVIDIQGATKVFNPGRSNQVEALAEIDLAVEHGEFHHAHRPVRVRQEHSSEADRIADFPHRPVRYKSTTSRRSRPDLTGITEWPSKQPACSIGAR